MIDPDTGSITKRAWDLLQEIKLELHQIRDAIFSVQTIAELNKRSVDKVSADLYEITKVLLKLSDQADINQNAVNKIQHTHPPPHP
jgi:predicted nucleic acid-binding protein